MLTYKNLLLPLWFHQSMQQMASYRYLERIDTGHYYTQSNTLNADCTTLFSILQTRGNEEWPGNEEWHGNEEWGLTWDEEWHRNERHGNQDWHGNENGNFHLPIMWLRLYSPLKKSWESLPPTLPASVTAVWNRSSTVLPTCMYCDWC